MDTSAGVDSYDHSDPKNQYPSLGCRIKHYEAVLETLSPNVRKRVEALKEIHSQHDKLEAKLREENAALDAKYQKLYQPLYTKRYEIVSGITEVAGNADAKGRDENKTEAERGVPDFWLRAMKRTSVLAEEIYKRDKAALKYLQDIKWSRIDDPKGFKLEFFFVTNPFFKNSVLTKTYHVTDEDKSIVEKAIGTTIEWYPGKCLTQNSLKKKHKSIFNYMRPDRESFFKFFNTPQVPDDIDEDDLEDFRTHELEPDYEIGCEIRDIIPHALSWFTGEARHIDGDDCVYSGYNEYDDSDSDDEEDEDDDYAVWEARRKVPQFIIPSFNNRSVKITHPDGCPSVLDPLTETRSASPIIQTKLSTKLNPEAAPFVPANKGSSPFFSSIFGMPEGHKSDQELLNDVVSDSPRPFGYCSKTFEDSFSASSNALQEERLKAFEDEIATGQSCPKKNVINYIWR